MKDAHIHFSQAAGTYTQSGGLQDQVATRLAGFLPDQQNLTTPIILELGCGTGFLTRHLADAYKDATFLITDKAEGMVKTCRNEFARATNMNFVIMDGQKPCVSEGSVDVIATSMTIQWFDDPAQTLLDLQNFLKPDGRLVYATIGNRNFKEWRDVLSNHGLDCGMRDDLPDSLPGQCAEHYIIRDYGSGRGFVDMLKNTGAGKSKPTYQKPHPRDFKAACDAFDGQVTWHIVYGQLPALG